MLPYQNGFDDFYNVNKIIYFIFIPQSIQDDFNGNEGFGKKVRHQQQQQTIQIGYTKNFKKILSVENFHGMQGYEKGFKKSLSTHGFEEHDYE